MQQKTGTGRHYTAVFGHLLRIYASLVFGSSRWASFIRKRKKADAGMDSGAKSSRSAVKTVLLALLLTYIGGCFILLVGSMTANLYRMLRPLELHRLIFGFQMLTAFFFIFISSFMLTLSTYYIGGIEQSLRAMPIPPRLFFGAKFLAHCLPAAVFSFCFFGVTAAVYGFYEHPPLFFYALAITGAVLFPLPVVGLCYLVHIAVMRSTKIFKNKRLTMLITGLFGITMAIGINYLTQSIHILQDDPALTERFLQYQPLIFSIMNILSPVRLFATALTSETFTTALNAFIPFILICTVAPAAIIVLLSSTYEKSLDGFDETHVKKLSTSETVHLIRSTFTRRQPVFTALVFREIRMMNREPAYLLNGPFVIILLPLLFGIMHLTGSLYIPPQVEAFMRQGFGALLAGVCGAFLGSATSIASTAVSRDAKNLEFIKSLPLSIKHYMQAKLIHAMLFAGIGSLIGVIGIAHLFSLNRMDTAFAFIIALSLALLCNLLALILDTVRPKLYWDTPAAAIKQNLNTTIMLFTDIILITVTVVTVTLTALPQWLYILCFAGLPFVISGILAHFFWPYAERKIQSIEI